MARVCELCGKHTQRGNKITTRGKAKYLGGVGTKITGKVRRTFKPNLQKIRAQIGGSVKRITVCTRCIRSGAVRKRVARVPHTGLA
ncbi:MAG: 50S ribosomal protein L28 [Planctomycetota bacterium]